MNCNAFKRSLYHFQADELSRDERNTFQAHLEACPPCADLHEVEQGLLRGVRARLSPTVAPPGLETRIRARLGEARIAGRPGIGWLRRPWFAALAATLLLAVLLFPSQDGFRTAQAERVTRIVTLVDRVCDRAGRSFDQQRLCDHPKHLNVLRLDDGTYWSVSLDDAESRRLITDRATRGTRMRVEGLLYERIHTLQLESIQPLGAESARLAFH